MPNYVRYLALSTVAATLVACQTQSVDPKSTETSGDARALGFDSIPGQFPPQPANIPGNAFAPVGACVSLERVEYSTLKIVDCGSPTNGYKIIQRVSTPDQCPADVAQKFYMNYSEGQFTACLDYAWSTADCLSIGNMTAVRAACDDTSKPNRERPLNIVFNTTSKAGCPTGGFTHAARKFTICTETQK